MSIYHLLTLVLFVGSITACAPAPRQSADVEDSVRSALDRQGLKDVSVNQDREKGVVTLTGNLATAADKAQAAVIAQGIAPGQVIANEIAVVPPGMESEAREIHDAVDEGIDSNMKAMLVGKRVAKDVSYSVRSRVVTLSGTVSSQTERDELAKVAATVPNVEQVVNELQVTNQKATTRKP